MKRKIELTIDIKVQNYNRIKLKQFDTTEFNIHLLDNGLNINLEENSCNLIFTKPDKTIVSQICKIREDNMINVTLLPACLREKGPANIEIEVKDADNVASSFYIPIMIEPSSKENIHSDNTPNYIEELENAVSDLQKQSKELLENINNGYQESLEQFQEKSTEAIQKINEDYQSIVGNVKLIIENYNQIQQNVSEQVQEEVKTGIGKIEEHYYRLDITQDHIADNSEVEIPCFYKVRGKLYGSKT